VPQTLIEFSLNFSLRLGSSRHKSKIQLENVNFSLLISLAEYEKIFRSRFAGINQKFTCANIWRNFSAPKTVAVCKYAGPTWGWLHCPPLRDVVVKMFFHASGFLFRQFCCIMLATLLATFFQAFLIKT